jgi:alkylresorcinol/alkylpyrone synthase
VKGQDAFMKIASVAGAFPEHYYSQTSILAELRRYWADRLTNPMLLERLHRRIGVHGRYLAFAVDDYYQLTTWGQANGAWSRMAQELGEKAIQGALERSGLAPTALGAFFFVSVTGIASPSIDACLMNRMQLPRNLKRMPIFGLGCVAGAAGIARAADYVRAYPKQAAVLLSVELCSLTLQRDDLSMANLISAGLFGDGAAAVVVAGSECPAQGPTILGSHSFFYPGTEYVMGWDISEKGFRIVLSPDVPLMVKTYLADNVDAFLADFGLTRRDIGSWIAHPGGPKILDAVAATLELPNGALDSAWNCLRRVGNLSSASVLLVLEEIIQRQRPPAGTYGMMLAMGPGFCSELVLLRW